MSNPRKKKKKSEKSRYTPKEILGIRDGDESAYYYIEEFLSIYRCLC